MSQQAVISLLLAVSSLAGCDILTQDSPLIVVSFGATSKDSKPPDGGIFQTTLPDHRVQATELPDDTPAAKLLWTSSGDPAPGTNQDSH